MNDTITVFSSADSGKQGPFSNRDYFWDSIEEFHEPGCSCAICANFDPDIVMVRKDVM